MASRSAPRAWQQGLGLVVVERDANLAEAVCAWLWHERGIEVALDAHYIAKLERGAIGRTGRLYRDRFRAVFGVATDRELGMGALTIRSQPSGLRKAQSLT